MQLPSGHAARAAGVGCAFILAACAGLAPEIPPTVIFVPPRTAFEATGRISVRHGADALTANFRWHHDGERDELDLASPLGQTVARLSGGRDGVALRTADGRVATGDDWSGLMARSLDWSLPIDGLASWIQGAPRTGAPFDAEPAGDGQLHVLRQSGWTIVYQSFVSDAGGAVRPARMTLSYPDIELRLVVDSWQ